MSAPPCATTVWDEVRRLARVVAAREPLLRDELDATVLAHDAPAAMLAAVLARRLDAARRDGALHALIAAAIGDADDALLAAVEADLAAATTHDPACRSPLHALLHLKGFQALQCHRAAHALWRRGRHDAALWLAHRTSLACGVDIHPAAPFGRGVQLDHATGTVIGETAVVDDDVTILHHVTLGATGHHRGDRHPKVRRGALLGAGCTVLGNVEVGAMSRVAAGSVVLDAVPAWCTVAGAPARVVRMRFPQAA